MILSQAIVALELSHLPLDYLSTCKLTRTYFNPGGGDLVKGTLSEEIKGTRGGQE